MHGKTCVELDASSSSNCSPTDYYDFIKLDDANNKKLDKIAKEKAKLAETLFTNKSRSNNFNINFQLN